ncbi:MAG: glycosyltransferase family 39 protein [Oligoflexia bacterium]|nr:glycosyltransferase family 39 protein [Oligoflexia bacterium]
MVVVSGLSWMLLDQREWIWDQAWYGEVTLRLHFAAIGGAREWLTELLLGMRTKAPGLAWIGQFFVPLSSHVGGIEHALLVVNLLALLLSCWLVYLAVSRDTGNAEAALIAGFALVSMPMVVALSHEYMVETLQLLSVSALIWATSMSRAEGTHWHLLILIVVFGLSVKISTPAYMVAPAILMATNRRKPRRPVKWAIVVVGIFVGLVLAWYYLNFKVAFETAMRSASGDVAQYYGKHRPYIEKLSLWALAAFRGFGLPLLFVGLRIGAVFLGRVSCKEFQNLFQPYTLQSCAILELVLVMLIAAGQVNEDFRYLNALGPYVAYLFGFVWYRADAFRIRVVLLLALIVQHSILSQVTFGSHTFLRQIIPVHSMGGANTGQAWARQFINEVCMPHSKKVVLVASDLPELNIEHLQFSCSAAALSRDIRCACDFRSIGWKPESFENVRKVIYQVNADYILISGRATFGEFAWLNQTTPQVRTWAYASPDEFEELPFKFSPYVAVFRRRYER